MREIKFRAWDSERKKMFYQDKERWGLFCRGKNAGNEFACEFSTHIDNFFTPEMGVIMQFTGLHDKNGGPIYEGDIIASPHFKDLRGRQHFLRHQVKWSEKYSGWFLRSCSSGNDEDGSVQLFVGMRCSKQIEIIGNIYQDPELIKGEQDG